MVAPEKLNRASRPSASVHQMQDPDGGPLLIPGLQVDDGSTTTKSAE